MIPAARQIGGAELIRFEGYRIQKLIVQFRCFLWLFLADICDVQRMAVLAEHCPVVLPAHTALVQPAAALEHTLGEDDIDLLDWMLHEVWTFFPHSFSSTTRAYSFEISPSPSKQVTSTSVIVSTR